MSLFWKRNTITQVVWLCYMDGWPAMLDLFDDLKSLVGSSGIWNDTIIISGSLFTGVIPGYVAA